MSFGYLAAILGGVAVVGILMASIICIIEWLDTRKSRDHRR